MPRLLLISYYFPPDGGAGTQRAAKFCKYLPALGWDVTVLTREGPGGKWAPPDPSLSGDIPEGVRVIRAPAAAGGGWAAGAFASARELCRSDRPDVALVTMSPFTLAGPAREFGRHTGVPVVLDLRDPWTLDGWPAYRSWFEWRRDRRVMREALGGAPGVIANTPEAGRCIAEVLSGNPPEHMTVIPNGYDAEDFSGPAPQRDGSKMTIVITGSLLADVLYPAPGFVATLKRRLQYRAENISPMGRTPLYLLRAIRAMKSRGRADSLRVVLVGIADDATHRLVRESGVSEHVELTGYVPHAESVGWVRRAEVLFLPLHGLPPGARSRIVPGKTYEYLAAGRPILGCLPMGDARELVEASGVGFLADPCDEQAIAARLAEILGLWQEGLLPVGRAEWVANYERRALTTRLDEFLRRVIGGSWGGHQ